MQQVKDKPGGPVGSSVGRFAGTSMVQAVPALPVTDLSRSVAFYRDRLGFAVRHQEAGFAILGAGAVELHLWHAGDRRWRLRLGLCPVVSGAESFIAGTASCRIGVEGVDALYGRLEPLGIVHPKAHLRDQPWGTREFGVLDPDGNLITFFETWPERA